jgi:hypothetical protein
MAAGRRPEQNGVAAAQWTDPVLAPSLHRMGAGDRSRTAWRRLDEWIRFWRRRCTEWGPLTGAERRRVFWNGGRTCTVLAVVVRLGMGLQVWGPCALNTCIVGWATGHFSPSFVGYFG